MSPPKECRQVGTFKYYFAPNDIAFDKKTGITRLKRKYGKYTRQPLFKY